MKDNNERWMLKSDKWKMLNKKVMMIINDYKWNKSWKMIDKR